MLRVIFNIDAGNYYCKSTFRMALIKQEKLESHWLFYTFGRIYVFLQNCLRVAGYPKISNFGYPVPEITDLYDKSRQSCDDSSEK